MCFPQPKAPKAPRPAPPLRPPEPTADVVEKNPLRRAARTRVGQGVRQLQNPLQSPGLNVPS